MLLLLTITFYETLQLGYEINGYRMQSGVVVGEIAHLIDVIAGSMAKERISWGVIYNK